MHSESIAEFVNHFGWPGRLSDTQIERRSVSKPSSPKGPGWLDDNERTVLDLRDAAPRTWIRDEIRENGPGFYLGTVYWRKSG